MRFLCTIFFVSALAKRLAHLPTPTSLNGLRTLHLIASEYHQTPAQQMGISDPLTAFCVNRACRLAGTHWKQPEQMRVL